MCHLREKISIYHEVIKNYGKNSVREKILPRKNLAEIRIQKCKALKLIPKICLAKERKNLIL